MPKLKNKASAKKRFKITAKGKVRFNSANLQHMLRQAQEMYEDCLQRANPEPA